ncbi:hypothetical protein [Mycobacterium interjectum]|uniref:hypothetical protein n=1 Tax=Mycobacterium interjectum TaxID=33895 RepID=UPI00082A84AF|nr:hypothetical protein [Mycobacterium interjectum]MCV7092642.1 hypothetical protein [Mycobacterium interjectum]
MAGMRIRPGDTEEIASLLRDGWRLRNGGPDQDNQPTLFCYREYQHWDELAEYVRSHGYEPPRQVRPWDLDVGSTLRRLPPATILHMTQTTPGQILAIPESEPTEPPDSSTAADGGPGDRGASDTTVTLAMLDVLESPDRKKIAKTYLEQLIARQDWRGMADKELLTQLQSELRKDPADQVVHCESLTALTEEMLRSKAGLTSKQHAAFLQKRVDLVDQLKKDLVTWRKLAWWAIGILLFGVATSIAFTSWGFILVSDSKLKGYELTVLIFVLALVTISPPVLLLLQRPLKGMDNWSPSPMKVGREKSGDYAGGNDAKTP